VFIKIKQDSVVLKQIIIVKNMYLISISNFITWTTYIPWNQEFALLTESRRGSAGYKVVLWKLAQGGQYFSYTYEWNYIYACAVKPYDILTVKNTLKKSVYCRWVLLLQFCSLTLRCQWSTTVDVQCDAERTECPLKSHDFGLMPHCKRGLCCCGILYSVDW
jgi:hypothetical protein